ncbi:MAG TPA: glucose-6-phosphate isomerase, partial [Phenylobacterium sp.]|nr:glucose-6-phosphate isomerase [Phenylobacterium sp.]
MTDAALAWSRLEAAGEAAKGRRIASLFAAEPDRLEAMVVEACGLRLDFSKQPWTKADLAAALELAKAGGVEAARGRLFAGETVNASEGRAALHMALRAPAGAAFKAQGVPVSGEVEATRAQMKAFAGQVRSGALRGATGEPYSAIVHIGIGGSDLGPRVIWEALRPLSPQIELRFAANVDPAELALALDGLDPARTLVVVVSKTFTTQETIA